MSHDLTIPFDIPLPRYSIPTSTHANQSPSLLDSPPASERVPATPIPAAPAPDASPFVLSIEVTEGRSPALHGFHLGTNADLARHIAALHYHGRVRHRLPVVTVALLQDGKVFDVYYGDKWHSELEVSR